MHKLWSIILGIFCIGRLTADECGFVSLDSTTVEFPPNKVWCCLLPPDIAQNYQDCQGMVNPTTASTTLKKAETNQPQPLNRMKFEGDIDGIDKGSVDDENIEKLHNAVKDESKRWPKGEIPYLLSNNFANKKTLEIIRQAMEVFHNNTCVRFVERNHSRHPDYIYIAPSAPDIVGNDVKGCSSYPGKQSGRQTVSLDERGCITSGIAQHELMHSLGFYHEQSRTDRDEFIDINYDNIAQEDVWQFHKYTDKEVVHFGFEYDFNSVLHYATNSFGMDPNGWTIRPKDKYKEQGKNIGQRNGLSMIDIGKINAMYNCTRAGPCPKTAAWKVIGQKCYFFSFLGGVEKQNWFEARKFCRTTFDALLAVIPRTIKASIQATIRDKLGDTERVWLNNLKTISGSSLTSMEGNGKEELHFLCSKKSATKQEQQFFHLEDTP